MSIVEVGPDGVPIMRRDPNRRLVLSVYIDGDGLFDLECPLDVLNDKRAWETVRQTTIDATHRGKVSEETTILADVPPIEE